MTGTEKSPLAVFQAYSMVFSTGRIVRVAWV